MARKTKEDALETRNQLLDAAERMFLEKGFSHTSLADIAKAAGMTRGAIYWHFKNKAELFEAMVERVRLPVESLGDCCTEACDADPLGRLREFAVLLLKETARNQRRRRVFTIIFHRFEFNEEAKAIELRQQAAFVDSMQRIEQSLRQAQEKEQLSAVLSVHKAAIAYQAYFTGLIANWLFFPGGFDLEKDAESMVDCFFDMLQNTPPR